MISKGPGLGTLFIMAMEMAFMEEVQGEEQDSPEEEDLLQQLL